VAGSLGLATDPNRYSIACRATGPVSVRGGGLPKSEVVFGEKMSPFFKEVRVTRMYDADKRCDRLSGVVDDERGHRAPRSTADGRCRWMRNS